MISISKYRLDEDDVGRLHVKSYEIIACPVCGGVVIVIGTRERGVTDSSGEDLILVIRRLRCKGCRVIHHELPDIIVPYKRHCCDTIEKIVASESGVVGDAPCETRTITRIRAWWAACILYFNGVLASLREKYGVGFPADPAPKEIIRAVVNAHLWIHTRSVTPPT